MEQLDEYQKSRMAAAERRRLARTDKLARKSARRGRKGCCLWRFLVICLIFGLIGAGVGWLAFDVVTAKYSKYADEFNLEDINNLDHPCIIYDRNGEEIGRIYDENRSYVTLDKVSTAMINALVAQEDKSFWEHDGYDPVGILRAAKETLARKGDANQGASTITQQLARNAYDLEERVKAMGGSRYERKIVEIFLARRIEKKYDKRQIIEFYFNRVYFGRGYYGIRSASLGYFGKEPADLTVREAASIAALIKNPENYNPIRNPKLNQEWRNDVLDRMVRSGYITEEEAKRVKAQPLGLNPKPLRRNVSHLHAMIQQKAIDIFRDPVRGEEILKSRGIKIYTTIDRRMQETAEQAVQEQLAAIEKHEGYKHVTFLQTEDPRFKQHRYLDAAVFAVDNITGGTLAYVGGRSFDRDNFDIIDAGRRPLGTAMLPFLYLCAFENNYTPCSRLVDDAMDNRLAGMGGSEGVLGEWGMEVSKGRYLDSVTARQALEWSKIAASARLGIALGSNPDRGAKCFTETLERVGITSPPRNAGSTEAKPQFYPRAFLGAEPASLKEVTMAYTIFPNAGRRPIAPYIVTKITDSNGKILWEEPLSVSHRMHNGASACNAFRLHSIMRESMEKGSAQRVRPYLPENFNGAVKTGTNYDFSDNAIFGYTSSFTCGVWVGYLNDHQPIYAEAFASDTCAPILGKVLAAGRQSGLEDAPIAVPADTEEVEICRMSGQIATNFCFESVMQDGKPTYVRPTYLEYFPKGDMTLGVCPVHGDGSPSLSDFLDMSAGQMNASRVLPVLPVLPKGTVLTGQDPYNSDVELKPKYASAEDLPDTDASAEEVEEVDESDSQETAPKVDSTIELPAPRSMRNLPLIPLEI